MSTGEHKDLVRRYYESLWNRWDFALAEELIAEDIVFRGSLGDSVRGREGFKDYMRAVRRAFPDFHNQVEELVAEGDRVVARLTYTGTHAGALLGIAPTGRRVNYAGVALFRWEFGVILNSSGECRMAPSPPPHQRCERGVRTRGHELFEQLPIRPLVVRRTATYLRMCPRTGWKGGKVMSQRLPRHRVVAI